MGARRRQGRPRRHARPGGHRPARHRLRRGDEDRPLRRRRPQGLPLHRALGRRHRDRRRRGRGHRHLRRPPRRRRRSAPALPAFTGDILPGPAAGLRGQGRRRARLRPRPRRRGARPRRPPAPRRAPRARRHPRPRHRRPRDDLRQGRLRPQHRPRPRRSGSAASATSPRSAASGPGPFTLDGGVDLADARGRGPHPGARRPPAAARRPRSPACPSSPAPPPPRRASLNGNPMPLPAPPASPKAPAAWASRDGVPLAVGTWRGGALHPSRVFVLGDELGPGAPRRRRGASASPPMSSPGRWWRCCSSPPASGPSSASPTRWPRARPTRFDAAILLALAQPRRPCRPARPRLGRGVRPRRHRARRHRHPRRCSPLAVAGFLWLLRQPPLDVAGARRRSRSGQRFSSLAKHGFDRPRPDLVPHGMHDLHRELPVRPLDDGRRHLPDARHDRRPGPADPRAQGLCAGARHAPHPRRRRQPRLPRRPLADRRPRRLDRRRRLGARLLARRLVAREPRRRRAEADDRSSERHREGRTARAAPAPRARGQGARPPPSARRPGRRRFAAGSRPPSRVS